jgi:hypothetical protein
MSDDDRMNPVMAAFVLLFIMAAGPVLIGAAAHLMFELVRIGWQAVPT